MLKQAEAGFSTLTWSPVSLRVQVLQTEGDQDQDLDPGTVLGVKEPTCGSSDGERVQLLVKRLAQFQGQPEGLTPPHDQLILGGLAGVVVPVVGVTVELHPLKD